MSGMRAWLLLGVALAAACTSTAQSSTDLRARVAPAPTSLAARAWSPTITITRDGRPASAPLRLTIRKGSARRTFIPRAARPGTYRTRVAFPSDGRWTWAVTTVRRTLARGVIKVSSRVLFELPYDLAVAADGTVYFLDRSRVLLLDPATHRIRVYITTSSLELTAMVRLADGTLFVADLTRGRILRVDPAKRVTTVAEVPAPADLFADPAGKTLWVASIAGGVGVVRVEVASGRVEPFARVQGPHGIDRDQDGNFYVHDGNRISRVDGRTGSVMHFADVDGIKLLVAPDRSVYGIVGDPSGGRVIRAATDGSVSNVVGTGSLGPDRDGQALAAQILPSAVQFGTDGALLVAQVQPVPAIRRVDVAAGTITTLVRGR
jgi:hypothetical protein